jgi:hypothetical protein
MKWRYKWSRKVLQTNQVARVPFQETGINFALVIMTLYLMRSMSADDIARKVIE